MTGERRTVSGARGRGGVQPFGYVFLGLETARHNPAETGPNSANSFINLNLDVLYSTYSDFSVTTAEKLHITITEEAKLFH